MPVVIGGIQFNVNANTGQATVNLAALTNTLQTQGQIFQNVNAQINTFNTTINKTSNAAKQAQTSFSGLSSVIRGFTLAAITREVIDFGIEAAKLAGRVDQLGIALEVVGRNSGYSKPLIHAYEDQIKSLGVTTEGTRKILIRMLQTGLDPAQAAKLLKVAQDASVISGKTVSETAEALATGIENLRPRLLWNYGIVLDLTEAYKRYADSLGRTDKYLTEAEKKQAVFNETLRHGADIAGAYAASQGTLATQLSKLDTAWQEFKLHVGKGIGGSKLVEDQASGLTRFNKYASKVSSTDGDGLGTLATAAGLLLIDGMNDAITVMSGGERNFLFIDTVNKEIAKEEAEKKRKSVIRTPEQAREIGIHTFLNDYSGMLPRINEEGRKNEEREAKASGDPFKKKLDDYKAYQEQLKAIYQAGQELFEGTKDKTTLPSGFIGSWKHLADDMKLSTESMLSELQEDQEKLTREQEKASESLKRANVTREHQETEILKIQEKQNKELSDSAKVIEGIIRGRKLQDRERPNILGDTILPGINAFDKEMTLSKQDLTQAKSESDLDKFSSEFELMNQRRLRDYHQQHPGVDMGSLQIKSKEQEQLEQGSDRRSFQDIYEEIQENNKKLIADRKKEIQEEKAIKQQEMAQAKERLELQKQEIELLKQDIALREKQLGHVDKHIKELGGNSGVSLITPSGEPKSEGQLEAEVALSKIYGKRRNEDVTNGIFPSSAGNLLLGKDESNVAAQSMLTAAWQSNSAKENSFSGVGPSFPGLFDDLASKEKGFVHVGTNMRLTSEALDTINDALETLVEESTISNSKLRSIIIRAKQSAEALQQTGQQ